MTKRKKLLPKIKRKRARSQFEFDVFKQLKNLVDNKRIEYEVDKLPYTVSFNYVPDFTITKKDGTIIYVEAKGLGRAFDNAARVKMISVKKEHPEKDIRIVFMSDRPFRKGGKMRPSDWAVKYDFPFAIKQVPKDWFNE